MIGHLGVVIHVKANWFLGIKLENDEKKNSSFFFFSQEIDSHKWPTLGCSWRIRAIRHRPWTASAKEQKGNVIVSSLHTLAAPSLSSPRVLVGTLRHSSCEHQPAALISQLRRQGGMGRVRLGKRSRPNGTKRHSAPVRVHRASWDQIRKRRRKRESLIW